MTRPDHGPTPPGALEAIERGRLSGTLEVPGPKGAARIRFFEGAIVDVRDPSGELAGALPGAVRERLLTRMEADPRGFAFEELIPHLVDRPSEGALLVRPVTYPVEPAPRPRDGWVRRLATANAVLLVVALVATAVVGARSRLERRAVGRAPARLVLDSRTGSVTHAPLAPPREAPTTGLLVVGPRGAGHRIFVDDRVVGEGAGEYTVKCQLRRVQVGSAGLAREVDVPCGGRRDVD